MKRRCSRRIFNFLRERCLYFAIRISAFVAYKSFEIESFSGKRSKPLINYFRDLSVCLFFTGARVSAVCVAENRTRSRVFATGMNNPYLLKKQLQENEEELSSFMRDMNIWREQMKRKENPPPFNVRIRRRNRILVLLMYNNLVKLLFFFFPRIPMRKKNKKLIIPLNLVQKKYLRGTTMLGTNSMW